MTIVTIGFAIGTRCNIIEIRKKKKTGLTYPHISTWSLHSQRASRAIPRLSLRILHWRFSPQASYCLLDGISGWLQSSL